MAIFNSYVKLPEGTICLSPMGNYSDLDPRRTMEITDLFLGKSTKILQGGAP